MKINQIIIGFCLVAVLAFTAACTQNELEQVEGILQNVDAANGEITIVTKDGQTVTYKVDTEVSVDTDGAPSTLDTLEVGSYIQIEVDEETQVVQLIKEPQSEKEVEVEEESETTVSSGESDQEITAGVRSSSDDVEEADEQTISNDDNEPPGDSNGSQDGPDDGDGSDQNTTTSPAEPPDDVTVTVPDGGNILAITLGTVLKIEGGFWTIVDQDGVIWVVDVNNLDLDVDTVVGSKITLSAIIYDEGIVAGEAEVYPPEDGVGALPPDDGEGDHPDDGEGDHID